MGIEFSGDNRITVKVRSDVVPKMIGKKGVRIEQIEREIGMKINVESKDGSPKR